MRTTITINRNRDLVKFQRENRILSINGNLITKNNLASLEISHKHCYISSYTPFGGHKNLFLSAPYVVEFETKTNN